MQLRRGLDLRQLQVFVEIADAGSITSAAHRLGISQAAASQQVARLEERLGLPLLERTGREFRLTTAGARLVDEGEALLASAGNLFKTLESYRVCELPRLRLYVLESLATMLVPTLVPRLRSRIGELEIHCALQLEREHELIFDKDAVALTSLDFGALHDAGTRLILSEPFFAVVGRQGREDVGSEHDIAAISSGIPFIRYLAKRRMAAQVERVIDEEGLAPSTLVTVDSSPAMIGLVASGCGWTITTPSCLLTAAPDPASVHLFKLERHTIRRRIVLIADDHRLMDFPQWIAAECCMILEAGFTSLRRYADWLPSLLSIGDRQASR